MQCKRHAGHAFTALIPSCVFYGVVQYVRGTTLPSVVDVLCWKGADSLLAGYYHPMNDALFGVPAGAVFISSLTVLVLMYASDVRNAIACRISMGGWGRGYDDMALDLLMFVASVIFCFIASLILLVSSYPIEI